MGPRHDELGSMTLEHEATMLSKLERLSEKEPPPTEQGQESQAAKEGGSCQTDFKPLSSKFFKYRLGVSGFVSIARRCRP